MFGKALVLRCRSPLANLPTDFLSAVILQANSRSLICNASLAIGLHHDLFADRCPFFLSRDPATSPPNGRRRAAGSISSRQAPADLLRPDYPQPCSRSHLSSGKPCPVLMKSALRRASEPAESHFLLTRSVLYVPERHSRSPGGYGRRFL